MASRNERKAKAKARHAELIAAQHQAFLLDDLKRKGEAATLKAAQKRYAARVTDAMRDHKAPVVRLGKIVKGRFVPSTQIVEPPKRKLILSPTQGKMIERKRSYI